MVQNQKCMTSEQQNTRKYQYSSVKIKEHQRNDTSMNNQENCTLEKVPASKGKSPYKDIKEESHSKLKSKYNSRNIRLFPKKLNQSFKEEGHIWENPQEKLFN